MCIAEEAPNGPASRSFLSCTEMGKRRKLQRFAGIGRRMRVMRFDTLIRGGTIVTATDTYVSDVGITGGKISVIGLNLPAESAGNVIEARAMLVMPGGIDVHTHLDMPFGGTTSADDFETGTVAAAYG